MVWAGGRKRRKVSGAVPLLQEIFASESKLETKVCSGEEVPKASTGTGK